MATTSARPSAITLNDPTEMEALNVLEAHLWQMAIGQTELNTILEEKEEGLADDGTILDIHLDLNSNMKSKKKSKGNKKDKHMAEDDEINLVEDFGQNDLENLENFEYDNMVLNGFEDEENFKLDLGVSLY